MGRPPATKMLGSLVWWLLAATGPPHRPALAHEDPWAAGRGPEPEPSYTLQETYPPRDCIAAEACNFQPLVTVFDDSTGAIAVGFRGDMYATLVASPTGYELLYANNGTAGADGKGSTTDNAVDVYGGRPPASAK